MEMSRDVAGQSQSLWLTNKHSNPCLGPRGPSFRATFSHLQLLPPYEEIFKAIRVKGSDFKSDPGWTRFWSLDMPQVGWSYQSVEPNSQQLWSIFLLLLPFAYACASSIWSAMSARDVRSSWLCPLGHVYAALAHHLNSTYGLHTNEPSHKPRNGAGFVTLWICAALVKSAALISI